MVRYRYVNSTYRGLCHRELILIISASNSRCFDPNLKSPFGLIGVLFHNMQGIASGRNRPMEAADLDGSWAAWHAIPIGDERSG